MKGRFREKVFNVSYCAMFTRATKQICQAKEIHQSKNRATRLSVNYNNRSDVFLRSACRYHC